MSIKINPLSAARGQKLLCEICGQPGKLACAQCRVTFYCSKDHQSTDWSGIHETICPMLPPLRNPTETFVSEDERQRHELTVQMNKHALIDLARKEATKFLLQDKYELAIPAALQSLRFTVEVYGKGHIELVKSHLLLAEANMGLNRFETAEKSLAVAQWSIYKQKSCPNSIRSHLHRLLGKAYFAQNRMEEALHQLALDVYHAAIDNGPEHIATSGGLFHMGLVFLQQESIESALAFFDKVVEIWYKFLSTHLKETQKLNDVIDETKTTEAIDVIQSILETREELLGSEHIATGEARYVLGLLTAETGDSTRAYHLFAKALHIYELQVGSDHELTRDIRKALDNIKSNLKHPDQIPIEGH